MSEKIPHIGDKLQPLGEQELHGLEELAATKLEKEAKSHERSTESADEQLAAHRKRVEQQAISGKERSFAEKQKPKQNHPILINNHLKSVGFDRALTRARKKLSPPARMFSKAIHNPLVEQPSEFIGKTIARPSSMFWGALFSFIGTSALLWITRHYGYEYNYLLVILLFVGGGFVGILFEFGWRALKRK